MPPEKRVVEESSDVFRDVIECLAACHGAAGRMGERSPNLGVISFLGRFHLTVFAIPWMIAEGIRTRQTVIDAMLAHARAALPEECCGLLLDCDGVIDEAIAATNVRHSPTRFEIDPHDHVAAIRKARATGRTVRAAYHSHPAGPPG